MTTIVDTDVLIGLTISADVHFDRVNKLYDLLPADTTIYMIAPTLAEFVTLSTIKAGFTQTQQVIGDIVLGHTLITITEEEAAEAVELYKEQTSKENSLFDCYVVIVARRLKVDCIFSFDGGYRQNGLTLIEDFLKTKDVVMRNIA